MRSSAVPDGRSFAALRARVEELAASIGAGERAVPAWGHREDSRTFVLAQDGEFRYGLYERGSDFELCTTRDPDELLYRVMRDIAAAQSTAWELAHRVPGQDVRIVMFQRR